MDPTHGPAILAKYIRSLSDFALDGVPAGNYGHMGATLTEVVLQAGVNYKHVVFPRVQHVLNDYPQAKTVSGFLKLLRRDGTESVLQWNGKKVRTVLDLCEFLSRAVVETEAQFAKWLTVPGNSEKLLAIDGVGPKTVDYAKILVGIDTSAVDVHVRRFVAKAGLPNADYEKTRALVNDTADLMGLRRAVLDYAIWAYLAE